MKVLWSLDVLWKLKVLWIYNIYLYTGGAQSRALIQKGSCSTIKVNRHERSVSQFQPRSGDMGNGNGTDKLFVDSFNGFGLDQCISGPTHNKGRTLDLMCSQTVKTLSQKSTSLQICIFVRLTIIY